MSGCPDDAAGRNADRWVDADLPGRYRIRFAEPLCDPANPALLDDGGDSARRLVVWDAGVPDTWRRAVVDYYACHGVAATVVTVEGGEHSKSLDTATRLLAEFHAYGLDRRREPVVAVGGGAVLDVAGFAASLYRRGVPLVRVPTTLLAYVDASIGIKTGINFEDCKNLIGSFSPPRMVLLERGFFDSQLSADWVSGFGEIVKLGLGCEAAIFDDLEAHARRCRVGRLDDEPGRRILTRSIDVMLRELGGNIHEHELARSVDLGHTFSQAFEMAEPAICHGRAVTVDLVLSSVIAHQRGLLATGDLDRLVALVRTLDLPVAPEKPDCGAIWASLQERVQHRSGGQRTPLPTGIGACTFVDDLTFDEIASAVDRVVAMDSDESGTDTDGWGA